MLFCKVQQNLYDRLQVQGTVAVAHLQSGLNV